MISPMNDRPLLFALFFLSLAGCAGPRAAPTMDPRKKIAEASQLYTRTDRPVAAERLLREAIADLQKENDDLGLALAYNEYGHLLASAAVEKQADSYRKTGFLDKTITYDHRLEKALTFFDRAAPFFIKAKRYDGLSNNRMGRGIALAKLRKTHEACNSLNESAAAMKENLRQNPRARPYIPDGQGSWEDYLAGLKSWAGCR